MVEEYEKHSPVFDWEKGDFVLDTTNNVVTVTAEKAVEQFIIKTLQTARGVYLIYANLEDLDHKYGSDVPEIIKDKTLSRSVKEDEIKRAIEEALIYLDWIQEVNNITFNEIPGENDALEVSLDVVTIFDKVIEVRGLAVNA
jgi:hypothetical protein